MALSRLQNDRLSEVLKTMKWEEPISRPKGRAREDVLIAALEDVLRESRNKTEADRKASEQVRLLAWIATLHCSAPPG